MTFGPLVGTADQTAINVTDLLTTYVAPTLYVDVPSFHPENVNPSLVNEEEGKVIEVSLS